MSHNDTIPIYDYLVIGSGFGGSVSAMRLTEKGYSVLVLERGRRFRDQDFPSTNWIFWKFLWIPPLRCFGMLQISPFREFWTYTIQGSAGAAWVMPTSWCSPMSINFPTRPGSTRWTGKRSCNPIMRLPAAC